MKKFLLSLALFAGAAFSTVAETAMETELTITPVWVNAVVDGVANPIPDIDGGWGKPTATNPGDKTVCRFAVGKDGKILLNNHKENAIMAWDGKAWSTYAKLPAVTVTDWNGNETDPNSKWNGTAITTDDAGNVIYDYCFINADKSLKYWGVVAADGTITDVELSTPLADLGTHGRLDILGHIVGDVNSEKGGIGYATTQNSNNVIMFHFKGDGKKVTSLTAKSFEVEGLASNGLYVPSPKCLTVDELMANGTPEKEFYVPYGSLNSEPVLGGYLASGDETLTGFGNRQYNTSAVFTLHGNKYIVRSYVTPNNPNNSKLTGWRAVMTFGIFDLATGECIATWQDSEFSNTYGMGTITAEPVDDDTVNVYMFVVTSSKDDNNPAVVPGGYAGMFTVTAEEVPAKPKGTAESPYIISTPQDLVNMITKLKANGYTYFELANDIDMAGVTYTAPAQASVANIHLDGKNHVIKNLKIEGGFAGLFARMNGSVKNLGFVDVDLTCSNWGGAGAIAGYIANDEPTTIENCFVTGKIQGQNAQLGSFACGNYNEATISNCYSTAVITSTGGGMQGGFVGAVMYAEGKENVININNSYFGGSITGASVGGFVGANQSYLHPETGTEVINIKDCALLGATLNASSAKLTANTTATATVKADNIIVARTTLNGEAAEGIAMSKAIPEVMAWNGFNATQVDETTNLPILAWQIGKEYVSIPDGTKEDPFIIATAQDLCNAWRLVDCVNGGEYWFVQTADIDMKDVKEYTAIAGYNGSYESIIHYDGQNHIIKNFHPNDRAAGDNNGYYCTSVFGVPSGEIMNLGVVDANVTTAQGAGILGAYAGHDNGSELTLTNVFVTGEVSGEGKYTGGMFGTTGNDVNMVNCFANVTVSGGSNTAGLIGRLGNELYLEQVYVAGTVQGDAPCLVCNTASAPTATVISVVAFNDGATAAFADGIKLSDSSEVITVATDETKDALIAKVAEWEAFSAEKLVDGLPGLNSFNYPVFDVASVKETIKLTSGSAIQVNYALTVGFVNSNNVFAVDAAGDFIQLYGKNSVKVGDVIPAGWAGKYDLYNGTTPEIKDFTLPAATAGTFTPKEVAAGSINANMVNSVIVVKNVAFAEATPDKVANFTGKVGDVELTFRNNYTIKGVDAGLYDVTVVVNVYQGKVQLYVINYAQAAAEGDGTAQNPYVISSAADLSLAYKKVAANPTGMTYFVQTADIDMAGVKEWHAINGFNGTYTAAINYDGQNHLIKNFAPEVTAPDAAANNYYMGTIFGVLTGTVKNLGVVDAKVVNNQQGGGFLAAYAGHGDAASIAPFTYIENVFVTGTYDASENANYIGGLVGTTGSSIEITNCFVNADIKAQNNVAGLVGRLRHDLAVTHSYVAGTVAGTGANVALAVSSDKTPDVIVDGVYAFNTGAAKAVVGAVVDEDVVIAATEAEVEAAIKKINYWKAYSKTDMVYGLPGLDGFGYTAEVPEPVVPVVAESVKETLDLEAKTVFTVNYELTVGFVDYKNVFACDAAGDFIQLYGENTLKVGDKIPAGWEGTYDVYNGTTPEIVDFTLPEVTEGTFEPAEVAAEDVTVDLVNSVVVIKGVVLAEATPATKDNFTGKVGDVELNFYNRYTLESVEAGTYDITVVVNIYEGAPSLYVVNYVKDETTGLEGIEAAGVDAVYYNLQGVEVANPESGIYIVRRGNKVTKEVIRK